MASVQERLSQSESPRYVTNPLQPPTRSRVIAPSNRVLARYAASPAASASSSGVLIGRRYSANRTPQLGLTSSHHIGSRMQTWMIIMPIASPISPPL